MKKNFIFCYFLLIILMIADSLSGEPYRVLGLGSPCIDYIIPVEEKDLKRLQLHKGGYVEMEYQVLKELVDSFQQKMVFAGDCTTNTIRGLASLGIACRLTGRIGKDLISEKIRQECTKLKIETHFSESETTAQIACLITPDGEKTLCAFVKPELEITEIDLKREQFQGVDLVHLEGFYLRNGCYMEIAMELAEKQGCAISIDLANSGIISLYRERILGLLEKYVDIVFLNEAEAYALTQMQPKAAALYLKNYCDIVVVKVADQGCWVASEKCLFCSPAITTTVVDKTGAGDLFASGFLYGYLHHYSLRMCARFANLAGGAAVERFGAELPLSKWQEIKHVMEKRRS